MNFPFLLSPRGVDQPEAADGEAWGGGEGGPGAAGGYEHPGDEREDERMPGGRGTTREYWGQTWLVGKAGAGVCVCGCVCVCVCVWVLCIIY